MTRVTAPRGARAVRRGARPSSEPLRIAFLGQFSGLLSFPRELFAACPPDVELSVFDRRFRGRTAEYLRPIARRYEHFEDNGSVDAAAVAAAINAAHPDMVVNIGADALAASVLERLDAPCVVNYCTGSNLFHHPAVDVEMHGQPQPDYFVRDGAMFCGLTAAPFSRQPVLDICGYYDARSLDVGAPTRPWRDREPLIIHWGGLQKLGAECLSTIFAVMDEERSSRLVLMGRDRGRVLARILDAAARRGLAGRVHYDGEFSAMRGPDGRIDDEGWLRLVGWLERARLAPDPWPIGGGSARFEAYAAGVPSVHLGVRFDRAAWRRPQPATCDVVFLNVPSGTAFTIDDYRARCVRCLRDEAFADRLRQEQREVALRCTDAAAWWRQNRACYAFWRDRAGGAA